MTDDARRAILARRARFVAAALASAGIGASACGGEVGSTNGASGSDASMDESVPEPCLGVMAHPDTGSDSADAAQSDATNGASGDGASEDAKTDGAPTPVDAGPMPCLTPQ